MANTNIYATKAYKLGNSGENKVISILNTVNNPQFNLHNIILLDNGMTHQIDVICILNSGVFVIEVKNVCGYKIKCENDLMYWTYDWIKNKELIHCKLYNPIWQNRTHVQQIRKLLPSEVPIYSMITFSNNNTLVHSKDLDAMVVNMTNIRQYLNKFSQNVLSDIQRENIKNIILKNNHPEISIKQHIDNIKNQIN